VKMLRIESAISPLVTDARCAVDVGVWRDHVL
jgi:hypothetical protein